MKCCGFIIGRFSANFDGTGADGDLELDELLKK
jgi:hypothetical protein